MWKKEEVPTPTPPSRMEAMPPPERAASAAYDAPAANDGPAERATIGRSITIRGEVSGNEDLLIQGRVDGSVDLKQHLVTVGAEGEVKASISGRVVTVEGKVEGDVNAEEQVILRSSAWVQGNIVAPRVVLEDGARFRGGVDMGDEANGGRPTANAAPAPAKRAQEPAKAAAEPGKGPDSGRPAREPGKPAREPLEASLEKGKSARDTAAELTT